VLTQARPPLHGFKGTHSFTSAHTLPDEPVKPEGQQPVAVQQRHEPSARQLRQHAVIVRSDVLENEEV
jgi:hypothetical protein